MTQQEATEKVKDLVKDNFYLKSEIAKIVGISPSTITCRLNLNNWRKKEIDIIKKIK